MEKVIYIFILILALNINNVYADHKIVENEEWALKLNYSPIGLDRLPANVQEVLALGFPCFVVTSVELNILENNKKVYKVVLSDPENMEIVVFITNKGEVLE